MTQFVETLTIPGLTDDEQRVLNHLVKRLEDKTPGNLLRQRLYDNKDIARRVGDSIPGHYFTMGICLGWTGKAVDALGRRCNLERFVWPEGDLDALGARQVWDENNLRSEFNSAKVSSLIHGPSFLINTTGLDDEPRSLIHVRDALSATGTWNARRRRQYHRVCVVPRRADDYRRQVGRQVGRAAPGPLVGDAG